MAQLQNGDRTVNFALPGQQRASFTREIISVSSLSPFRLRPPRPLSTSPALHPIIPKSCLQSGVSQIA